MGWDEEPPRSEEEVRERKMGALLFSVVAGAIVTALVAGFWYVVLDGDSFWRSFFISLPVAVFGLYYASVWHVHGKHVSHANKRKKDARSATTSSGAALRMSQNETSRRSD